VHPSQEIEDMTTQPRRRPRGIRIPVSASAFALVVGLVSGCASDAPTETSDMRSSTPGTARGDMGTATRNLESLPPDQLAEVVEQRYVIGPAAARRLGYRVDWQYPSAGTRIMQVEVADDSVFTLDERNYLTRLRREDGDRVWRIPVAKEVERVFGITFLPERERILLTMGGEVYVLDSASGGRIAKHKLRHIANTAPIVVGPFIVYGSRDGMVVWHSTVVGTDWAAYDIAPYIHIEPVYSDGYLVAIGAGGRVMSLRADSATQVWTRRALAAILAPPAVGNGAVYVASMDQHLRAYELGMNRAPRWEYLTESPLNDAPVLIRDHVYQHVDAAGLICLEALPVDRPGGVVVWEAPDVRGNVVTQRGRNLLTWDEDARQLVTVDARLGAVVDTLDLPHVDLVHAMDVEGGNLYATAVDGRIVRLVPRN
jgi:outer membrane protein assembly factor BamB